MDAADLVLHLRKLLHELVDFLAGQRAGRAAERRHQLLLQQEIAHWLPRPHVLQFGQVDRKGATIKLDLLPASPVLMREGQV